jgi:transposase
LLGLNWHQVEAIKKRAVQRGLSRRECVTIPYLGIDEKQFLSGHCYISTLVDVQGGRVLDIVEDRTEEACKTLIEQSLSEDQRQQVTAVALDMWKAYANAVGEKLPQADIVHDRLIGTKFTWLVNEERISEAFVDQFAELKHADLKVSRAWALKELFRDFWTYSYAGWAKRHFEKWYA